MFVKILVSIILFGMSFSHADPCAQVFSSKKRHNQTQINDPEYISGMEYYRKGEYDKALDILKTSADKENKHAQFYLAFMYENGLGTKKNRGKAHQWYSRAAVRGHAQAQNNLALLYYNDNIFFRDYYKAFHWFQKGAQNGNLDAKFNLALMYYKGHGTGRDGEKAFKIFEQFARKDHAEAQYYLGRMYEHGDTVFTNKKQALIHYYLASKNGHEKAHERFQKLNKKIDHY